MECGQLAPEWLTGSNDDDPSTKGQMEGKSKASKKRIVNDKQTKSKCEADGVNEGDVRIFDAQKMTICR